MTWSDFFTRPIIYTTALPEKIDAALYCIARHILVLKGNPPWALSILCNSQQAGENYSRGVFSWLLAAVTVLPDGI